MALSDSLVLKGAEKWRNCWKRKGIKESVFSRRGKGMVACRPIHGLNPIIESLMRREEVNEKMEFLQRKKETELREKESFASCKENRNLGPRMSWFPTGDFWSQVDRTTSMS